MAKALSSPSTTGTSKQSPIICLYLIDAIVKFNPPEYRAILSERLPEVIARTSKIKVFPSREDLVLLVGSWKKQTTFSPATLELLTKAIGDNIVSVDRDTRRSSEEVVVFTEKEPVEAAERPKMSRGWMNDAEFWVFTKKSSALQIPIESA